MFVSPDIIPRPLLLCLHRSTLLGPGVVHSAADFSAATKAGSSDLLHVAAYLCGIRRLGVRFGPELVVSGRNGAGFDAGGGGAAFGRSFVTDLLTGVLVTSCTPTCVPLGDVSPGVSIRVAQAVLAVADAATQQAVGVAAAHGRFAGSGTSLALLSCGGQHQKALWIQKVMADYTTVFHHDPALFTSSGCWSDVWLAVDECLALCSKAAATALPLNIVGSTPKRPQYLCVTSYVSDSAAACEAAIEVFAASDVGSENSSAQPLRYVIVHPAEAVVRSLMDFIQSTSSSDIMRIGSMNSKGAGLPTLNWLALCGRVVTGTGPAGGDEPAPAREEDEGVSMGAGVDMGIAVDDDDTSSSSKRKGKAAKKATVADEEEIETLRGVVSVWRDARWHTKAVAIAVVRLLLHDWKLCYESTGASSGRVPRPVLMQIHDVLNLAGIAAAATDVGEGSASLQVG